MILRIQSALLLVIANSLGWFLVVFLSGFFLQKVSIDRFHYRKFPFRTFRWERWGKTYQKAVNIRKWKDRIPEAGGVFKGFGKRRAGLREKAYLETFARETCRAEAVHYAIIASLPVFAIWNPPAALFIMLPIVLAGNVPCILIQRYNRPRLIRLIDKGGGNNGGGKNAETDI